MGKGAALHSTGNLPNACPRDLRIYAIAGPAREKKDGDVKSPLQERVAPAVVNLADAAGLVCSGEFISPGSNRDGDIKSPLQEREYRDRKAGPPIKKIEGDLRPPRLVELFLVLVALSGW